MIRQICPIGRPQSTDIRMSNAFAKSFSGTRGCWSGIFLKVVLKENMEKKQAPKDHVSKGASCLLLKDASFQVCKPDSDFVLKPWIKGLLHGSIPIHTPVFDLIKTVLTTLHDLNGKVVRGIVLE